jgi:hypothetical protein
MAECLTGQVHASPILLRTYTPPSRLLPSTSKISASVPGWTQGYRRHLIGRDVIILGGPKKGHVGEVRELGAQVKILLTGSNGVHTYSNYENTILMCVISVHI